MGNDLVTSRLLYNTLFCFSNNSILWQRYTFLHSKKNCLKKILPCHKYLKQGKIG